MTKISLLLTLMAAGFAGPASALPLQFEFDRTMGRQTHFDSATLRIGAPPQGV